MEPLKEFFNRSYYKNLAHVVSEIYPKFNKNQFLESIENELDSLELNGRMRLTSRILQKNLTNDYLQDLVILKKVITKLKPGYPNLVFPDYVAQFGLDFFEESIKALEYFTAFGSSEFAVRVFLKKDFDKTIKFLEKWADSDNEHVRRLASEGSRPRLPWSFKLDEVIKSPERTIKILRKLNNDKSLYVRKSVSNHLNDFSKDNATWLLDELKTWKNTSENTKWIIKQATRTLIKKGDSRALALLGFDSNHVASVSNFKLKETTIKLGDYLEFSFDIKNENDVKTSFVIDYAIHYTKKGGNQLPKVFKLKNLELSENQLVTISKKQLFKDFSTRKHHIGEHKIEILINGNSLLTHTFQLID